MIETVPNYFCVFSNIAFRALLDEVYEELPELSGRGKVCVMFTDGDAVLQPWCRTASLGTCFIVALVSNTSRAASLLQAGADLVVSKAIRPQELKREIVRMFYTPGRDRRCRHPSGKRGLRDRCAPSPTERTVLAYLLQGYTPQQIAGRTNLSINAIRRYRMMAVERSGFRNFNELVIDLLKLRRRSGRLHAMGDLVLEPVPELLL